MTWGGAAGRLPGPRLPARRHLLGLLDLLTEATGRTGATSRLAQPARQHQLRRLAVLPGRTAAAGACWDGWSGWPRPRSASAAGTTRSTPAAGRPWDPLHEPGPPTAHAYLQLERGAPRGCSRRQFQQACQRVLRRSWGSSRWRRRSTRRSRLSASRCCPSRPRPPHRLPPRGSGTAAGGRPGLGSATHPSGGLNLGRVAGAARGAGRWGSPRWAGHGPANAAGTEWAALLDA